MVLVVHYMKKKNKGHIYTLLFFLLFFRGGSHSSAWELNCNARFFLDDKQFKQVKPVLSMVSNSSADKHFI